MALISLYMASKIIQAYLYALAWFNACMGLIQLPGHVSFVYGSFMFAIVIFATVIFNLCYWDF